jgi:hypothetical protein
MLPHLTPLLKAYSRSRDKVVFLKVGPEYLLPSGASSCLLLAAAIGANALVEEIVEGVSNSKVTTQEVANILGIHISVLRLMMRQGKIAASPILFDPKTNSTGRMWSEDDIEAVRTVLKTASADS